ncbi:MAG: isochorismatase family protein [Deferribacteres bacterium]|nr:isochorismatase family protein [Deferribacteres bacterium]
MFKLSERNRAFIVVIDIQEKLLPAIYNEKQVVENTVKLVKLAETLKLPVVVTEQYPKGLGKTVEDVDKLFESNTLDFRGRVEKMTFSCMREPEFTDVLAKLKKQGYDEPIICGIEAHICVYQTVMDLMERGYTVHLASDAVGSRSERNHMQVLDLMLAAGANVKPTETIVFELLIESGTPEFKSMLPYLK